MKKYKNSKKPDFHDTYRIKISGEHFFTDNFLFSNFYGNEMFKGSAGGVFRINPFIRSPEPYSYCRPRDGYDDFADTSKIDFPSCDEAFQKSGINSVPAHVECTATGNVSFFPDGKISIEYFDKMPVIIYISKDNIVNVINENSPITYMTFESEKRNFQNITLKNTFFPFSKNEIVMLEFCVNTEKITNTLSPDGGILDIEYTLEVSLCETEKTHFTLEIEKIPAIVCGKERNTRISDNFADKIQI